MEIQNLMVLVKKIEGYDKRRSQLTKKVDQSFDKINRLEGSLAKKEQKLQSLKAKVEGMKEKRRKLNALREDIALVLAKNMAVLNEELKKMSEVEYQAFVTVSGYNVSEWIKEDAI